MKLELEQSEIDLIAQKVAEVLKPLLKNIQKNEDRKTVFDVKGLAAYLKVEESWVYNQSHLKTIPYFKCGKYLRFEKSQIDMWIKEKSINPVP